MSETKYPKRSEQPAGRERRREVVRAEAHRKKINLLKVEAIGICIRKQWIPSIEDACKEFRISPVPYNDLK